MKKVLLATTALVATAGFAAADITLSGSASMGLRYQEDRATTNNNDSDIVVDNEIDFTISGSGTSDSGVEFGASIDFGNSETDQVENHDTANDGEVFVKYNGFTVTVGDVGNQLQSGVADVGYQGLGIDDLAEVADTGNYDVNIAYAVSGFTLGASIGSDTEDMAVSVSGELSGVSFGISYTDIEATDTSYTELALGYKMGSIALNGVYAAADVGTAGADDPNYYGLSVAYTSGPMTLTAAVTDSDVSNQDANFGVGVAYDLGGGLSVSAGIGQLGATTAGGDSTSVADLGLKMSF